MRFSNTASLVARCRNLLPTPVAALLIAMLYAAHVGLLRAFFADDAFITFRTIRQWVAGNGLVFNIGERVEGYSNFLWLLAMTPFELLGVQLSLAAKAVGFVLGLLTLAVTAVLARRDPLWAIPPLLLAASTPFAAWSVAGLETPLFGLLLILSVWLFVREEEAERGWLSGVSYGLLALTRPEGILYAGAAVALRWQMARRLGGSPVRRDWARGLVLAAIVLGHAAWRYAYYGALLPNPVVAKAPGLHLRPLIEGILYLYHGLGTAGGFVFVALPLIAALLGVVPSISLRLCVLSLAVYALFVIAAGGDWMPLQRLLAPVLPLLYIAIQVGIVRIAEMFRRHKRLVIGLVVSGQIAFMLAGSLQQRFVLGRGAGPLVPDGGSLAALLRETVHAGDTVALVDSGIYAFVLPLEVRVVDMTGLTDPHIARRPARYPHGLLGRGDAFGKWDVDYVLAQDPEFVQLDLRGKDENGAWRTHFTGTALLANDPRFREAYQLLEVNDAKIFVRGDRASGIRGTGPAKRSESRAEG